MVQILDFVVRKRLGFDVRINSDQATVEDYRRALNEWIDHKKWDRLRNPSVINCAGCNCCCQERIPLTIIDIINLKQANEPGVEADNTIVGGVQKWGYVWAKGPVVDITLRRMISGTCTFLDPSTSLCRIYAHRPFVCQTYICCPSSQRAQSLREAIVNIGEDELVRLWLQELIQSEVDIQNSPPVNQGKEVCLSLKDWSATPFTGAESWSKVKLRDLCTDHLWEALRR
ncbi:MAG: YkgJ family cysteine cluster protein [Bacillota bacterium]|jgi:Fe-S-cluster containining protein